MSKTYLKIKIMSLAAEASIIRREERKWPRDSVTRHDLRCHRTHDVRREARTALLAYGYLRGRAYSQMEAKCDEAPNWQRIAQLCSKYGPKRVVAADIEAWSKMPSQLIKAAA